MAAAAGTEGRRAALEAAAAAAPERGGGSCVLCCGDLEATALGRCDHPVCYRCSTKMRVLCEQRYCAVCREELRQVRGAGGAAGLLEAGRGLCLPTVRPRAPASKTGLRATWGGVPAVWLTAGRWGWEAGGGRAEASIQVEETRQGGSSDAIRLGSRA
ncbi:hypothetical protein P7K49_022815 [Saguinus oedipus]|uniref:RING-type domain-containing protein n=1 Tax=Saguinus oedipus TaxID=9490 RepID=A0ABQ9UJY2_SAGOE|nr:hypothetical protein P7K49_022815 [Saguinus oedipus]